MFLSLFEMFLHQRRSSGFLMVSMKVPNSSPPMQTEDSNKTPPVWWSGTHGTSKLEMFLLEQSIRIQMEICKRLAMKNRDISKGKPWENCTECTAKDQQTSEKNDQNYHEPQRSRPIHRSSCCFWGKWLGIVSRRRVRYRQKLDFDVTVSAVVLYSNVASPPNLWYNEESWWSTKVTRVYPNLYHCMLCFKYQSTKQNMEFSVHLGT